jgi:transcriptional regulator with XRE-family HTH domain
LAGELDILISFTTPELLFRLMTAKRWELSQPVFARYLNVTTGLVSQWERDEKHPRGASLKLLTLVVKKGCRPLRKDPLGLDPR